MPLTEKDIRKISLICLLALLVFLAFFIIRPVLLSVLAGLILAYIFFPVYSLMKRLIKSPTISALLVTLFLILIIIVPLWFLLPLLSQQIFEVFKLSQELDVTMVVKSIFPSAADQFVNQIDLAVKSSFSRLTSLIVTSTVDILVNFFTISIHLMLTAFIFFFALRDSERLKNFTAGLLPLSKVQERLFTKQFGDITKSLLYGQVVAGVIQGALASLALYVFGVPNALILSIIALILSIIPVIGPGFVYVPVAIYMLINGNPLLAIGYLVFNIVIVSSMDNVFRSHFVSHKTNLSQAIVLIGMIGGLFVFNVLGLIIGPLILGYLVTFLKAYKENTLSSFFES